MRNRKHDSDSGISGSKLDLTLLAFLYTYIQKYMVFTDMQFMSEQKVYILRFFYKTCWVGNSW